MSWRKKFRFQVAPSDRQFQAIGLVAVQWTAIDSNLTMLAHGLYGEDAASRAGFNRLPTFRRRVEAVRDLVNQRVVEPHRTYLIDHLNKIGSIVHERDKIIHGLWGSDDPAREHPDTEHNATHSFNWSEPRPRYDWKLTYDGIMRVALKIDALAYELHNYLAGAMGYPRDFLLSDAVRRMVRKLDGSAP